MKAMMDEQNAELQKAKDNEMILAQKLTNLKNEWEAVSTENMSLKADKLALRKEIK